MVKSTEWRIVIRVLLLFATLTVASLLLLKGYYIYLVLPVAVIIYQVVEMYRFQKKPQEEWRQFVEAAHYRDFSRHFNVSNAPADLKPFLEGFNEINNVFKAISKEKETQHQYLQKILELVETGILSYEEESGDVIWMNESLKRMLQLPYMKTVYYLEKRDKDLSKEILALKPGDGKLLTIYFENNPLKILVSATAFNAEGKKYKLIAFQNVNEALDETESKAWQKLLSVMTHEIMNSVAPISSLADTLKNRLKHDAPVVDNDPNAMGDLELGIDTIKRRSEGLLKFAETYRNLNKITAPNLKKIYIRDLFENLNRLMQPTFLEKQIELEIVLKDTDLMLEADINLLEQLLINLVVNAVEAVKEKNDPRIMLSGYLSGNKKTIIKVADNGIGMAEEVLDRIFIPFFSTKKHGSGIGLSLCKQIMMLHHGNIQVQSREGEGTAFLLQF